MSENRGVREAETARLVTMYGLGRDGHSHFSASGSAGWMNCAGFLLANAGKPDMAGVDAAYGTVAHNLAATWLTAIKTSGVKAAEHVPTRFLGFKTVENHFNIEIDDDMIFHVRKYIDWCMESANDNPASDVFIETRIDYSVYTPIPDQGGTADFVVCSPGKMTITDLKMGKGVRVFAENNPQAMLYALGFFLEYDWIYGFEDITIRICQPRLDYFGVWKIDRKTLLDFGETVRIRADMAWRENAPRSPSTKACQWCADKLCPAKSALLEDLADDGFTAEEVPEYAAETLKTHVETAPTTDKKLLPVVKKAETTWLAWRLRHRRLYEKWFKEIYEELLRRAQAGEPVPGFKQVNGRRGFRWISPDDAAAGLSEAGANKDQIYKTEVVSVAEARKLLKVLGFKPKEIIEVLTGTPVVEGEEKPDTAWRPLVVITPGKPTLAATGDDRPDEQDGVDDTLTDGGDETDC